MTDFPPNWSALEIAEYRIIFGTLEHLCGNASATARTLKISVRSMRYKIENYRLLGLPLPRWLDSHSNQKGKPRKGQKYNDKVSTAPNVLLR